MTWIIVTWLSWACPGGWFSGFVPGAARPLVCQPTVEMERFDPAQMERARGRVRAMGSQARLYRCDNRKCLEIPVRWITQAEFGQ